MPNSTANAEEYYAQRNALGEIFGTKKAQKDIRARERNKIDVSAMEGVAGHIQASIEANKNSSDSGSLASILGTSAAFQVQATIYFSIASLSVFCILFPVHTESHQLEGIHLGLDHQLVTRIPDVAKEI